MVRAAAGIGADDGLEAARVKLAAMLPGHEDVTQRVGSAIGLIDESFSAEETFWAVRRALEISTERRPLVVLVDDIHWAERTLLDLLRFVVEECRAPVLLLCSSRRELLEEHPEWDEGRDRSSPLHLEPLGADEQRARDAEPARRDDLDAHIVERVTWPPTGTRCTWSRCSRCWSTRERSATRAADGSRRRRSRTSRSRRRSRRSSRHVWTASANRSEP